MILAEKPNRTSCIKKQRLKKLKQEKDELFVIKSHECKKNYFRWRKKTFMSRWYDS